MPQGSEVHGGLLGDVGLVARAGTRASIRQVVRTVQRRAAARCRQDHQRPHPPSGWRARRFLRNEKASTIRIAAVPPPTVAQCDPPDGVPPPPPPWPASVEVPNNTPLIRSQWAAQLLATGAQLSGPCRS